MHFAELLTARLGCWYPFSCELLRTVWCLTEQRNGLMKKLEVQRANNLFSNLRGNVWEGVLLWAMHQLMDRT